MVPGGVRRKFSCIQGIIECRIVVSGDRNRCVSRMTFSPFYLVNYGVSCSGVSINTSKFTSVGNAAVAFLLARRRGAFLLNITCIFNPLIWGYTYYISIFKKWGRGWFTVLFFIDVFYGNISE